MRQVFGNCSDVAKQMLVGYGIPGIAQISRYKCTSCNAQISRYPGIPGIYSPDIQVSR